MATKALILAAGAGTRLRPLTDSCPKPMLPIAGQPLLAWTLHWLRRHDVRAVALNLHHLPDVVRNALGDGQEFAMELRYAYEPELRGTAGALHGFPGFWDTTFAVVYGDMLFDIDLGALLAFHEARGALLTLALKTTSTPQTQGMVATDETGRVLRFVEKPTHWDGGPTANAGLYICEPRVLDYVPPGVSDWGFDIIPALLRANEPVYGHALNGYLLDIGTPAAYAQAQREWPPDSTR